MKLLDVSSCCEIFATRLNHMTGSHRAKSAAMRDVLMGRNYVYLQCRKSLLDHVTIATILLLIDHIMVLVIEGAGIMGAYNKTLMDTKLWLRVMSIEREEALRVFVLFHNTGRLTLPVSRLTYTIEREIALRAPGLPVFTRSLRRI